MIEELKMEIGILEADKTTLRKDLMSIGVEEKEVNELLETRRLQF